MAKKRMAKKQASVVDPVPAPRPRAARLPGVDDSALVDLENAAVDYEECRDSRMEASVPEREAKARLIRVMKEYKKTHYQRGDLCIDLIVEKENVKVRRVSRKKVADEDDDAPPF